MRRVLSFILILMLCGYTWVRPASGKKSFDQIKMVEKLLVKMKNSFYIGQYQVTNLEYRYFLLDLKLKQKTELYNKCLYDSLLWKDVPTKLNPYEKYYHVYPGYRYWPVVNIFDEAASEFCQPSQTCQYF